MRTAQPVRRPLPVPAAHANGAAGPAARRDRPRGRRPSPRISLAAKLAALLFVFLAVPAILYGVFREADVTKTALLIRSAQEEGRLITAGLQPVLSAIDAPSPDLADVLAAYAAAGRSVKLMFRPADDPASGFFYIAAHPPVPPEVLREERDRLDRQGILGRLAGTCALDLASALRRRGPDGHEEMISAINPLRTQAGCWVVVVSHTGGPLLDSSLGRSYWQTPEVRIAGVIYLAMALFAISIFLRIWRNLQRFSAVAREIRRGQASAGSFSTQNDVPELAGVAAAIDEMVGELGKLSHAVEHSASAVVVVDGRGRIEYANPAATALTGYAASALVGRNCRLLRGPGTGIAAFMRILRAAAAGRTWRGEFAGRRETGEPYWALASVAPSSDGATRPMHHVVVLEDITERKRAERQMALLMAELNHRVKNTLATVRSIATQTLDHAASPEEFREAFAGRLAALAQAHELLTRGNWEGADLRGAAERTLAPFARRGAPPWHLDGPPVHLQPKQVLALTLVLHELATNAVKYGALSTPEGRISIRWRIDRTGAWRLHLVWSESGGPPVPARPRRGFGSRLIEGSVPYELDGEAGIEYRPDGVRCTLRLPWPGAEMAEANPAEPALA